MTGFRAVRQPWLTRWQQRPAAQQATFLLIIDAVTNAIDYGFHIYLARVLLPADFAAAQTINTILLVVLTTSAVMQPVVARTVAEANLSPELPAHTDFVIFRHFFGRSSLLGLAGILSVLLFRQRLADWFNLPVTAVSLAVFMIFIATTRPVVAGMLQGQRRFGWFGGMRLGYAIGRFSVGLLLISALGLGLNGAIGAMPLGGMVSLLVGLLCLGGLVWRGGTAVPQKYRWSASTLTLNALAAYAAYMALLSLDLVWVNRTLAADEAALYATAVLLRRVLLLLPGAVIVIMFPRAVARVVAGESPDRLLLQTAAVVSMPTVGLTAVLALFGVPLIGWTLGPAYVAAAPLLGLMGVAMLGVGVTVIWLNFYLATRPLPFVMVLVGTAVTELILLQTVSLDLLTVTTIFGLGGWLPAIGGTLLYLFWLRPSLEQST
jgi:O-antigen/teichoic acid export membrane protein